MNKKIVYNNVRIINPKTGTVTANQRIIIEAGYIKNITDLAQDISSDYKIKEMNGGYALPGYFECHAHLLHLYDNDNKEKVLRDFLKKGITQVRDVGGSLEIIKKMHDEIELNQYVGPDIFFSGPMLEKSPLTWKKTNDTYPGFTVEINNKKDVKDIIIKLKHYNANLMKTFSKFDKKTYRYLVEQAKENNLPVTHDPGPPLFHRIPMDFAIEAGVNCIEHGKSPWPIILIDKLQEEHDRLMRTENKIEDYRAFAMKVFSLGVDSISPGKLDSLLNLMLEKNIYFCPTLTVFQGDPENDDPQVKMMKSIMAKVSQFIVKRAIKKRIKILIGVDSCYPKLTEEIDLLIQLGLSPLEIIKGITCYPAQWLGIQNEYGDLKPGAKANFVILSDNPLEDATNLYDIQFTIKNGLIIE